MPALSVVLLELRFLLSSLAQLAEHAAVNRRVVGSSPTGGAKGNGNFRKKVVVSLLFS